MHTQSEVTVMVPSLFLLNHELNELNELFIEHGLDGWDGWSFPLPML